MLQDNLLSPRPAWVLPALQALGRHELLSLAQLGFVVGRSEAEVRAGLDPLVAEGLLVEMETLAVTGAGRRAAFGLTRPGARLLMEATGRRVASVPDPKRALTTLPHELARADFALLLQALDDQGMIQLRAWETARTRIGDVAHLVEAGEVLRIPLVADALAVVEDARTSRHAVLIEVDMGTVSIERMRRKYEGYWHWWRNGDHVRRFGLRAMRVLTITPDQKRLQKLLDIANDLQGRRGSALFWFGLQVPVAGADFSPNVPQCLVSGGRGGRQPLFVGRPGTETALAGRMMRSDTTSPTPSASSPAAAAP